jgi:hypothetical protein
MLNAIVSPTKAYLCYLFYLCFSIHFAKGLAKCKFGGSVLKIKYSQVYESCKVKCA